jgi:hypothetical protein
MLDPKSVHAGNYGMRKSDYVYRPVRSRDKNRIKDFYRDDLSGGCRAALIAPSAKGQFEATQRFHR